MKIGGIDKMEHLNETFPGHCIGQRDVTVWLARSTDLSPLGFFLWKYLEHQVYKSRLRNFEEVENRITEGINPITPQMIQNSIRHFNDRLGHCQVINGKHFEHLEQ